MELQRQYSEAAARAEHCSTDRPSSTETDACSATTGTSTLATGSPEDRLQAGSTNVQSTQHWDTIIPQPSHHVGYLHVIYALHPTSYYRNPQPGHILPIALFAALHLPSGTL